MNVLECIECDSSAESDMSGAEYDFNKASDNAIDSEDCRMSHESDIVASSSSSSTSRSACLESVSNLSLSTSCGVSLLSVLKAPTPSDLSRKRKIARNPLLVGKKRVKNTNTQSNPKTIKTQKRVNEYPKEPFTVASGKLFCQGCHEELPLKKSNIEYHIKSGKHDEGKKRLGKRKANDQDIAQSLKKYNEQVHGRGETLPEQQHVFHVKVVKTFIQAGVPLGNVDQFRALFEETGYRLTDKRFLFDLIPFILEDEKACNKQFIQVQYLNVIFDGTSHSGEALAILVCFVNNSWIIEQ